VARRLPFADEKPRQGFAVGIARRGMLFDLVVDRLPCVITRAAGLFAQSNKAGDVSRARRLAGARGFVVVALDLLQAPDLPRSDGLLRADGERPHGDRAGRKRDEVAPSHSIISSAVKVAKSASPRAISRPATRL
jgi:hypothetical protein